MVVGGPDALANLFGRSNRSGYYPDRADARFEDDALFPSLTPGFTIERGACVFTIGSCFARNIEEHLERAGHEVPTLAFRVPKTEWKSRANGLLNEYNAGTIAQRIERAYAGGTEPEETIVEAPNGGFVDLLLPTDIAVSRDRALERRREIDTVYCDLPSADVVIVTLGLVEAWRDTRCGRYLNRIPTTAAIEADPARYELHVMDVYDCYPLLESAFRRIADHGQRVILTVSPVPFNATFTGRDAIVANAMSKAVLRVCAERLAQAFPLLDYFPSYEIVTTAGLPVFHDDNIHVTDEMVGRIVRQMLGAYQA